jgi:hypothetical protein
MFVMRQFRSSRSLLLTRGLAAGVRPAATAVAGIRVVIVCAIRSPFRRLLSMPSFVTIGYGDRSGYDRTDRVVLDVAHRHDERLHSNGALMGVAGLPVQVRNHDGAGVQMTEGPFLDSELPVAGFAVIEASSLEEAVRLVSGTPCAVAHGVVEVWPLQSAR